MQLVERALQLYSEIANIFLLFSEARRLSNRIKYPLSISELINIQQGSKYFATNQIIPEIFQLLSVLREQDARNIMEIGTERGGTLFMFCHVCNPHARIISLDFKYPNRAYRISMRHFLRHGQKVHLLQGNSHQEKFLQMTRNLLSGSELDFLFIDGDHSYEGVKMDYETYSPLVKTGGIVAFHDIVPDYYSRYHIKTTNYVGGVPQLWQELKVQFPDALEFIDKNDQDGYGIGMIYKK